MRLSAYKSSHLLCVCAAFIVYETTKLLLSRTQTIILESAATTIHGISWKIVLVFISKRLISSLRLYGARPFVCTVLVVFCRNVIFEHSVRSANVRPKDCSFSLYIIYIHSLKHWPSRVWAGTKSNEIRYSVWHCYASIVHRTNKMCSRARIKVCTTKTYTARDFNSFGFGTTHNIPRTNIYRKIIAY